MTDLHVKVCGGHTRPVCHIDYSGVCDGSYWFLSSSHDSKPMLRNGETGDWVGTFTGHTGAVYGGCIYEGAEKALTVSGDYSAKIWNCLDGSCLHTWTHPHYVKSCDWKDDRVLTGCFDKKVRLFDSVNYDADPIQSWTPHENVCKSVYFLSHGGVLTVSEDTIAQWDLRELQKPVRQITIGSMNCVDYVRQHQNLIVAAHKTGVSLIDCDTFGVRQPIMLEDVECASISPDGQNIAVGSRLLVKEYSVDGVIQRSHYGHHGPVLHIRYCPTGETYTSGAEDGMIRIWPTSKVLASHESE